MVNNTIHEYAYDCVRIRSTWAANWSESWIHEICRECIDFNYLAAICIYTLLLLQAMHFSWMKYLCVSVKKFSYATIVELRSSFILYCSFYVYWVDSTPYYKYEWMRIFVFHEWNLNRAFFKFNNWLFPRTHKVDSRRRSLITRRLLPSTRWSLMVFRYLLTTHSKVVLLPISWTIKIETILGKTDRNYRSWAAMMLDDSHVRAHFLLMNGSG